MPNKPYYWRANTEQALLLAGHYRTSLITGGPIPNKRYYWRANTEQALLLAGQYRTSLITGGPIPNKPYYWQANTAFPDFSDLMALAIPASRGGSVLTSRSSDGGGMSGGAGGAGLLSVSLTCSAHLALCSSSPDRMFPFSTLTGRLVFLFFPERVLVIS